MGCHYAASGIGLIEIIIQILGVSNPISFATVTYLTIYFVLDLFMTFSVFSILKIAKTQNKWANKLPAELRDWFYASRSNYTTLIVGKNTDLTTGEWLLIAFHLILLLVAGCIIWLGSFVSQFI